jgi:hypothetical protein
MENNYINVYNACFLIIFMPKKPAYFVDLIQRMQHELPADNESKSFGRSHLCDFSTLSPEDDSKKYEDYEKDLALSVSREQGKILHTKDGRILLIPLKNKSPMWLGTKENPHQTLVFRQEILAYGNYVTIGAGYQYVLRQYRDEEPALAREISGRIQDTQIGITIPDELLKSRIC